MIGRRPEGRQGDWRRRLSSQPTPAVFKKEGKKPMPPSPWRTDPRREGWLSAIRGLIIGNDGHY